MRAVASSGCSVVHAPAFKDVHTLEFAGLTQNHSETDLHGALPQNPGPSKRRYIRSIVSIPSSPSPVSSCRAVSTHRPSRLSRCSDLSTGHSV